MLYIVSLYVVICYNQGNIGSWKGCGILCQLTGWITKGLELDSNEAAEQDMLKVITKPLTERIIQVGISRTFK